MEVEKTKEKENLVEFKRFEVAEKGFEEEKEPEPEPEQKNIREPEIIKGYVTSHQDTSFIGIDSQGRPKLVETGDIAIHEEKKDMEIEGQGVEGENQNNNQEGHQEVDNLFM